MKHSLFKRKSLEVRLADNRYLDSFAKSLQKQGYAIGTVSQYVRECDLFCQWLKHRKLAIQRLTNRSITRYLTVEPGYTRSRTTGKRRVQTQAAVLLFIQHLIDREDIPDVRTKHSKCVDAYDGCLMRYQQYMENVRGLSPGTQEIYLRFVTKFLNQEMPTGICDWSVLSASTLIGFVQKETEARRGCGPQNVVTSIRSFVRFLAIENLVSPAMQFAIPGRKRYPQAPPQQLSFEELDSVLKAANDGTSLGIRNFAILLLLARLGLRAGEILKLQLSDINWSDGWILVRAGKTHTDRKLPLPADAAKALLKYLQKVRPKSPHKEVFLEITAPFRPLQKSPAITFIVKSLLKKLGLNRFRSGAHLLRHTMATHLVNRGASFFDIAELLGHARLRTTGQYAQLDFKRLAEVSMPWPEVQHEKD